jgi:DNA-binding GntR family transcriptional regulator
VTKRRLVGSLTEMTYATLRKDILACRLRPGQRLKIHEIAARVGVSPGAVREALSRLSAEELVVSEAQKGFRVAPLWADDLADLTRTRIDIETMCLRRAIGTGTIEWETRLVAASHRLSRLPAPFDSDEWAAAHSEYHLALVEACDSAWLLRIRAVLYAQSERYRRLSLSEPKVRFERDINAEHREIVEATLARDADLACRLLTDHLLLTATLVRPLAQESHADRANDAIADPRSRVAV